MALLAAGMYVLAMEPGTHFYPVPGRSTRLGRLTMAGELVQDVPFVPEPLRRMGGWVLSYVVGGTGVYRHADGRTQPLAAGCVSLIPPEEPHWYGTVGGARWSEIFAVFEGPLFGFLQERAVLTGIGPRRPEPPPPAGPLRALIQAKPRADDAAEHQLMALADWLLDAVRPGAADRASDAIAEAAQRLAGDTRAELSMHEVASAAGLPYDSFRRRFRAEIGLAPATYRNRRRLQTAADLLRMTTMSCHEIARLLGYTDEFHLSRRFREHFGVPPSSYRRTGLIAARAVRTRERANTRRS